MTDDRFAGARAKQEAENISGCCQVSWWAWAVSCRKWFNGPNVFRMSAFWIAYQLKPLRSCWEAGCALKSIWFYCSVRSPACVQLGSLVQASNNLRLSLWFRIWRGAYRWAASLVIGMWITKLTRFSMQVDVLISKRILRFRCIMYLPMQSRLQRGFSSEICLALKGARRWETGDSKEIGGAVVVKSA